MIPVRLIFFSIWLGVMVWRSEYQEQKMRIIEKSIKAFLEVGRERNRLVHQNFGSFTLEKTTEDIYGLYLDAKLFVDKFPEELDSFCQ